MGGDFQYLRHVLADGLGGDAVFLVVLLLDGPAALRLGDGLLHGRRHLVGVHDDLALGVPGGTADGLDKAAAAAQEALLVRVQNGHQRYLGDVQTLPQQVDANEDVELAQAQIPDDLHALHGVDVVVHVPHPDAVALQVAGQVLGHFFRQGGDQHPLLLLHPQVDFGNQIVDLPVGGLYGDFGV